jgi:tetratricopeptide (TPR) repeat protein
MAGFLGTAARYWKAIAACGICGSVAGTLITETGRSTLAMILGTPDPVEECLEDHLDASAGQGDAIFRVTMTHLRNDPEMSFSRDTFNELRRLYGDVSGSPIEVTWLPCRLAGAAGSADAIRETGEDRASRISRGARSDLVIWGAMAQRRNELELRLSHREDTTGRVYANDDLTFERLLPEEIAALLATKVVEIAAISDEEAGSWILPLAREILPVTTALVEAPPAGMDGDALGQIMSAHGRTLYLIGEQGGDNESLDRSIVAYRAALEEFTRERMPLEWATTQMNLGTALWTLGARETGTERLEEAVTAYRAALEERTRERVPLDWAMTQNNLGNALETLGGREAGTERLEEAVDAFRAALEERTRERVPLQWAMTQMNLGNALRTLGEREAGIARLEEAVAAFRAALEEFTRERVPLQWAATQNNLGNALQTLGARETGTERLEEAVTAYRAALEERTRERVPLDWAATTAMLGLAERQLAERRGDAALVRAALDKAVEAEAVLRDGGHEAWADIARDEHIPAARALLDRLSP